MPKILLDLKEKLLQEVETLLLEEGYAAVTIRKVAKRCGVGVGTVYNYFPSKDAMLAEYLLVDWRKAIAAIEVVTENGEAVARCIYDQLLSFAGSHSAVFLDETARGSFSGSFSPYHSLLRSQLSQPLRRFCRDEFTAQFVAEALLTWTVAGKEFCEIWDMLSPLF